MVKRHRNLGYYFSFEIEKVSTEIDAFLMHFSEHLSIQIDESDAQLGILMNLSYFASFRGSDSLTVQDSFENITSLSFSSCGQMLIASTANGTVFLFSVLQQNKIIPPSQITPNLFFKIPHSKLSPKNYSIKSNFITSTRFSPEIQLNPNVLITTRESIYLYQIQQDNSSKWNFSFQSGKNANLLSFDCPSIKSTNVDFKPNFLHEFNDIRMNNFISSDFYSSSTIFTTSSNSASLFDFNSTHKPSILSLIPQTDNFHITSSDLNKQFSELFLLGYENGSVSLFDMRQQPENLSSKFTIHTNQFVNSDHKDRFIEIKNLHFSPNNVFFSVRTFGDLLIFDIRNPNSCYSQKDVQWFKNMDSASLIGLENDKFGLEFIDDIRIMTGIYDEKMLIVDFENQINKTVVMSKPDEKKNYDQILNQVNCISINPVKDLIASSCNNVLYFHTIDQADNS